jgi:hypothetical protein
MLRFHLQAAPKLFKIDPRPVNPEPGAELLCVVDANLFSGLHMDHLSSVLWLIGILPCSGTTASLPRSPVELSAGRLIPTIASMTRSPMASSRRVHELRSRRRLRINGAADHRRQDERAAEDCSNPSSSQHAITSFG